MFILFKIVFLIILIMFLIYCFDIHYMKTVEKNLKK